MNRKGFLALIAFGSAGAFSKFVDSLNFLFRKHGPLPHLRPPGMEDEKTFLDKCIRCRACANVCEAGCIKFYSIFESPALAGTPYLIPREKSCNLCMNCTNICPSGALQPIEEDIKVIEKKVRMGTAKLIESNCLSHNGRICGVCLDACPLKFKAIILEPVAKPIIDEDVCIGCGRCEERCPQYPAAIPVRRKEPIYG